MFQHYPWCPVAMVADNFKGTFPFLNISYFVKFYRLQIVCMVQFMVKSGTITYYVESGALWVIRISFINWL